MYFFNKAMKQHIQQGLGVGVGSWELVDSVKNDRLPTLKFDFRIPRFFWVQKVVGMKESVGFLGLKSRESGGGGQAELF